VVVETGIGNEIVNLTIKETRNQMEVDMKSRGKITIVEEATPPQEVTLRREPEV